MKHLILIAVLFTYGVRAEARTDVKAKVQQLQENVSSSKANLDQYEANLKTILANITETDRTLKLLEKQKQAVTKQTSQSAKDQTTVDTARRDIELQIKGEQDKLTAEEKQIEDLKQTLQRLEANREKRKANLATYDERLKKVDTEKTAWTERNQSVVDLEQSLKAKEEEAKAEKKRLLAKKAEYEEEIGKWKKQVRLSERAAASFSKLKEQ